uniref:DUF6535 domain-containing protein n=1 Tax=Moniliophthora roreri TaxID=221103 RepID=A0A0W0FID5_MONRR
MEQLHRQPRLQETPKKKQDLRFNSHGRSYYRQVVEYDVEMEKDIDTLLVFAGSFSAVVTALVIESRATHPNFHATRRLADTLSECLQSEPEASSIRINCFWFLSLIFSLTSALCGLLRWLR